MENNDDFKGDLRKSNSSIIKIKIRSHNGMPLHKSEFRLNDKHCMIKELNLLKDKFGVDCFELKGQYKKVYLEQQEQEISKEKKSLDEWRKKTRGLREVDSELQKKVKESLL